MAVSSVQCRYLEIGTLTVRPMSAISIALSSSQLEPGRISTNLHYLTNTAEIYQKSQSASESRHSYVSLATGVVSRRISDASR